MDNNTFYINLSEEKKYQDEFVLENGKPLKYLGPVNDVNIFVGANNSRKSRIMRMLMLNDNFKINQTDLIFNLELLYESLDKLEPLFPNTAKDSVKINVTPPNSNYLSVVLPETYNTTNSRSLNNIFFGGDKFKIAKEHVYTYLNFQNPRSHNGFSKVQFLNFVNDFKVELKSLIEIMSLTKVETPFELKISDDYIELNYNENIYYKRTLLTLQGFNKIKKHEKEIEKIIMYLNELKDYEFQLMIVNQHCYVPILRSAVSFFYFEESKHKKHTYDFYKITTNKLYDLKNEKLKVYTGRTLYEDIKTARNNIKSKRKQFEAFEKFIGDTFFNRKIIDIIAYHQKDSTDDEHIKIKFEDDTEDLDLHHVGDGIQSLIILLYPLFIAENEEWFFIEEPEMNLHPSMQRIFLDTITNNKIITEKKLKIFFTTHSNHLLDLSIENPNKISIFSFEKSLKNENKSIVRNISSGDLEVLNQLGVNNSSVFMANCSVWVEGHTDRKYIKGFIELYKKMYKDFNFKEDIHYSFFEYAGGNVVHYDFEDNSNELSIRALSLSNRLLLISDEDSGKEEKHINFKKQLKDNYITTTNFKKDTIGGREIENILAPKVFTELITEVFKTSNYELPKKISHEEYLSKKIGEYLKTKYRITNSIKSKSGAIAEPYKGKFADVFLELIHTDKISWNDLGEIAQEFCKTIIKHIKDNNRN